MSNWAMMRISYESQKYPEYDGWKIKKRQKSFQNEKEKKKNWNNLTLVIKTRDIHVAWMAKKAEVLGPALWSQLQAVPHARLRQRLADRMM